MDIVQHEELGRNQCGFPLPTVQRVLKCPGGLFGAYVPISKPVKTITASSSSFWHSAGISGPDSKKHHVTRRSQPHWTAVPLGQDLIGSYLLNDTL
ncbi:hypothetical protein chiPu_0017658 [Chiloscyllium punctatum]|uniref:Uncharacterized protein n=1 Tax=Chiloscyllium punctatum TaxID=137246 RepID=A0A401RHU6_CHIPU|nr:hypothetical protein [Chiloscyllium punctatum]